MELAFFWSDEEGALTCVARRLGMHYFAMLLVIQLLPEGERRVVKGDSVAGGAKVRRK
jgi:hypothetical protein